MGFDSIGTGVDISLMAPRRYDEGGRGFEKGAPIGASRNWWASGPSSTSIALYGCL